MSRKRNNRNRNRQPGLPSWVPAGHPHTWTTEQDTLYCDMLAEIDYAVWERIDDAIYDRKHDRANCDLCPGGSEDQMSGADIAKAISEMTDDEWAVYCELEGYSGIDIIESMDRGAKVVDITDKLPCNCSGPGSKEAKWPTHITSCPQYDGPGGYKPGSAIVSKYKAEPSCKHDRDIFPLDDGLKIAASAYRDIKYLDDETIDIGVYMYDRWQRSVVVTPGLAIPFVTPPMTQGVYIDWPDFGTPDQDVPVLEIVQWMLAQMQQGVRFETACMGGHGRTGTMLALLLVAQGVIPPDAVTRVRTDHCKKGIESKSQLDFIASFYADVHGNMNWRSSSKARKAWDDLQPSKSYGGYKGSSVGFQGGFGNGSVAGKVWDWATSSWKEVNDK